METKTLLDEIYTQYSDKIFRFMRSKIYDTETAEDLCSEVFLKICQKIDSYDESKASLSTWIYTVARNTLTDYYRGRQVMEEIPEHMTSGESIEDELCNAEELNTLADALEKLDERSRDIIILRYYSGLTLKETA